MCCLYGVENGAIYAKKKGIHQPHADHGRDDAFEKPSDLKEKIRHRRTYLFIPNDLCKRLESALIHIVPDAVLHAHLDSIKRMSHSQSSDSYS